MFLVFFTDKNNSDMGVNILPELDKLDAIMPFIVSFYVLSVECKLAGELIVLQHRSRQADLASFKTTCVSTRCNLKRKICLFNPQ